MSATRYNQSHSNNSTSLELLHKTFLSPILRSPWESQVFQVQASFYRAQAGQEVRLQGDTPALPSTRHYTLTGFPRVAGT